ncbi:thiamine ABC transporter substrate-binding protein [Halapricum desulfuricans]|nr:thiamine ABC transporter substrate-binding protein [Halapricum desulfuricans]
MRRRTFLRTAGAGSVVALAGCTGNGDQNGTPSDTPQDGSSGDTQQNGTTTTGDPERTLTVATYSSFTGEDTAGNYLKSAFEDDRDDVTVEFEVPENGLNQYILQKQQGSNVSADMYLGLNTAELVRAEDELDAELFLDSRGDLDRADAIKSDLEIDPEGRAVTYDTGYITLVYDEDEVESPATFDELLEPAYEDALITQNAQQSDPGRAFLLWTIADQGEDEYLDYWQGLLDNGVRILSDWEPAYNAYLDGSAPMVVSYSTDQVYYHGPDVDMSRHQVGFIEDQGYANPEAMARFADTDTADLALEFMDFVLQPEQQAEIAVKNVQFPAVEDADPGEEFSEYAYEPPEPVTHTYDELQGKVDGWIEQWARQIAGP